MSIERTGGMEEELNRIKAEAELETGSLGNESIMKEAKENKSDLMKIFTTAGLFAENFVDSNNKESI